MKDFFTIGEVSRLFRTNVRTLRYYDSIGLLKPAKVDKKTGYRYYSTKEFERLNTIKYLRTLDVPLESIALFFENKETRVMRSLLEKQKEQIQNQIYELGRIRTKIDNRLKSLAEAENTHPGEIVIQNLERQQVVLLRKNIAVTDDLELPIRELERQHNLEPIIFLGKVGVSIAKEKIVEKEFSSFSAVFVIVEPSDEVEGDCYLEAGKYLTIRFQGTHTQAPAYYEKLLYHAQENHYEICGDSIEITLVDSGLTNDVASYVTEIRLPFRSFTE